MPSESARLRVGLIGPGKLAGQYLAPAFAKSSTACRWSVLGRDMNRTAQFAHTHSAHSTAPAFTELQPFLADPDLDAVLITTPDSTHALYAVAALERRLPVLVEKPMCVNMEDGFRVVATAARMGTHLAVGYHLRHHAGLQLLCEKVHDGVLGEVRHMRVQWTYLSPNGPPHWRNHDADTCWWSLGAFGTHLIDLIRLGASACLWRNHRGY